MPDRGGEREDALGDSGANTADGAAAVSFEVKVALEGPVDGLDHVAQGFEEFGAGPGFLSFAGGTEQFDSRCCQAGFEVFAEVVLVTDQDLPAARWCSDGRASGENVFEDGALVGLGTGSVPSPLGARAGCRPDADVTPRRTANVRRSTRIRPSRPDRNV